MQSILAHQPFRVAFVEGEFVPSVAADWTIQSLDYFECQAIYAVDDTTENIRQTLARGLVDCPAGKDAFLGCPSVLYVLPLYRAIWAATAGNLQGPTDGK
jgi:hypothetical protein